MNVFPVPGFALKDEVLSGPERDHQPFEAVLAYDEEVFEGVVDCVSLS